MKTVDKLVEARKLLEAAGYQVSEKPTAWVTVGCVVEFKVQARRFSEKDFKFLVEGVIKEALEFDLEELQSKFPQNGILNIGNLSFKQLANVKGGTKGRSKNEDYSWP